MESEQEIKTDPSLVILIFAILAVASILVLNQITRFQGEDKIPLQEQGKENLKELLVTGTGQKVLIPPINSAAIEESTSSQAVPTNKPPSMIINKETKYQAVLNTTEGKIVIALNTTDTPITANNFISLSKENFYNSTIFHRVIRGFMIQGGDPLGTGAGGPGYRFADELFVGEYTRGTVAMANAGPNTNGSQFFIMHQDKPLPKSFVIFGKVIEGIEVVDKIAEAPITVSQTGENSSPIKPVQIETVEIIETPISAE
jgi:cyclophilin family peptidyl-prolyl cis-trans isomerase